MINYYTIRILISIMVFCILKYTFHYIFIKRQEAFIKKQKIIRIFIVILVTICYGLIWGINYESYFLKFKQPENVFFYYYPNKRIVKKYEYSDYAVLLYKKENKYHFTHFVKTNNLWKSEHLFSEGITHYSQYKDNTIISKKIESRNVMGVAIRRPKRYGKITVTDLLNTHFDMIEDGNSYVYTGISTQYNSDKYIVEIDGKEHNIFNLSPVLYEDLGEEVKKIFEN